LFQRFDELQRGVAPRRIGDSAQFFLNNERRDQILSGVRQMPLLAGPLAPNANFFFVASFRVETRNRRFDVDEFVHLFLFCTFAATFNRSALSRMKPVASSWL
jgi:hypothetical protein